ncbi:MAG: LysM peptidoglycan-binding domain-containing protein, partial [Methylococcales bacterium]|nr:LysM peptidoglycan-binding domain-containing protein [Methylococcales bacterium]
MMVIRFFVFIILISTGCTTNQHYAPVRPYQRDLINTKNNYVVKQGDTLYSIGFRSGHGYRRLASWNNILPPYKLRIGQQIKLFEPKQKLRREVRGNKKINSTTKKRYSSQKTSTISNNNKKVLKLYWQWPIKGKVLKTFS